MHLRSHKAADLQSVINELLYVSYWHRRKDSNPHLAFLENAVLSLTPRLYICFPLSQRACLLLVERARVRFSRRESTFPLLSTFFNELSTGTSTSHISQPIYFPISYGIGLGTSNRGRTDDLPRMKRMLFQLSYTGI